MVDSSSPLPDFGSSESENLHPPGSYDPLGNLSLQAPLEFEPDLKTLWVVPPFLYYTFSFIFETD